MQAIILAAGIGQRLGDLTKDSPKALVRVGGRELILRVMDFLDHPAVTERIVVTGFASEKIAAFLGKHRPNVKTVNNPNFTDGSIRSIETALPHINGDFLLMNVDHIYPKRLFGKIVEKKNGLRAVCDFDRELGSDDMKVKLDENKMLERIRKTLDDFDGGYIGMTFCESSMLPAYRAAVKKTRMEEGDSAAVEFALGTAVEENTSVGVCDTSGIRWLEVDTKEDLSLAERALEENPGFLL